MTRVGLAYNLIRPDIFRTRPIDAIAEFDTQETIQAVVKALETAGHEVLLLEADESFAEKLRAAAPEILFNIAEGMDGDGREAQVPSICELHGIPYTGSGVLTLSTCLNKKRANEILSCHHIRVPPSQEFYTPQDELLLDGEYPLIVKLVHEGSSMGLSEKSVVEDEAALRRQVDWLIHTYHEPVLVQKYIAGREFTVGILGNRAPFALPITEVTFKGQNGSANPYGIVTFCPDDEVLPMIEQVRGKQFVNDLMSHILPHQSICPAEISPELAGEIGQIAIKAFSAMECRDWCRVDFRMDRDGQIYVLELNPIAGIQRGSWLPNAAEAGHIDYDRFINKILDIALERIQEVTLN
jgi:D-alanine-D-alanine ligase-like ATP-grasp enzyme